MVCHQGVEPRPQAPKARVLPQHLRQMKHTAPHGCVYRCPLSRRVRDKMVVKVGIEPTARRASTDRSTDELLYHATLRVPESENWSIYWGSNPAFHVGNVMCYH